MGSPSAIGGVMQKMMSALSPNGGSGDPSKPPQDKDAAVQFASDQWNNVKEAFTSYHQMSWEALLFYAGQTWVRWDASRKIFEPEAPADDWVPLPKINRFSPTVDSVVSNFNEVPEIEATAGEKDDDPLAWGIADIASKLASDWMEKVGLKGNAADQEEDKVGLAAQTFVLMGGVFTIVMPKEDDPVKLGLTEFQDTVAGTCAGCDKYYNDLQPTAPQTGDILGLSQGYNCPQCGQAIQKTEKSQKSVPKLDPNTGAPMTQDITRIDATCKVGLPLFALPRPGSTGMHNTPFFFWAERITTDEVYFETGEEIQPDSDNIDGYESGYDHALNYFYQGVSQLSKSDQDSALVVKCYIPPKMVKEVPNGAYLCMAQGQSFYYKDWDFIDHPVTYSPYQRIPTLFFGRSMAFECAGVQREYQSYESLIKLHGMTSAVEPIIVDENTQVSDITGRADKVIKWRSLGPGSKEPHRMQHGQLDEGIYRQRQSLRDEFENVSGAVAVYKGMQPGSVTAASAIDKLKGQAEQTFAKPVLNWHSLWRETVRKAVAIRHQNWSVAQIAEVVGMDKLSQIEAFKKANLVTDVEWVSTMHGLPRSREEKKQEMMMLWDKGALDLSDPNVREKAFQLFGDIGVMNNFNLDATRARVENKGMQAGTPAMPMPEIEDMMVHLAIHKQTAKSLDFDAWPQPCKTLLLQHILQTQEAMELQQMKAAAVGAPPPKPGSGPAKPGAGPAGPPQHQGAGAPPSASPTPGPAPVPPSPMPTGGPK